MMVEISRARAEHVAAIFKIRTSVRENRLDMPQLEAMGITYDSISEMLEENACGWVAQLEGRVCGFAIIDPEGGELFALFVDPGAEGRGVGQALSAAAEAALWQLHPVIHLTTAAGSRAEGFYRRRGWQVGESLPDGDLRLEIRRPG